MNDRLPEWRLKQRVKRRSELLLLRPKIAAVSVALAADRVGPTDRKRIGWAVSAAQRDPGRMTPGDWMNFASELTVFCRGVAVDPNDPMPLPSAHDAARALPRMGEMLRAAAARAPVQITRYARTATLVWNETERRWQLGKGRGTSFLAEAEEAFADLVVRFGHLLKRCPAPKAHGTPGEDCGRWFVAPSAKRAYCSTTCQTRATTRRYRARHGIRRKLKRQQRRKR